MLVDLNGDGNLDLAGVTHESYGVLVLLGDGAGQFAPAPGSPFPSKSGAHPHGHGLLAADVNHDRHLDLLVIHSNPDNALAVLLNDGQARFAPASGSPFSLGPAPYPAALIDVNRDGHLDVAAPATESDPPLLTILHGDGLGAFGTPVQVQLKVLRPFYVGGGDIDGDQDPDLLVTHDDAETMSLLLNNGHGSFTESVVSPFPLGGPAWNVVIADLNADGRQDFATAGASHVRVFLAEGERGRFSPAAGSPYLVPKGSWRLALADLNADGKQDLITCGVEDHRITLLLHR